MKSIPSTRVSYELVSWSPPIDPTKTVLKIQVLYTDGQVRRLGASFVSREHALRYLTTFYPELIGKEVAR